MRKCNRKYQIKRSGVRGAPALAHQVSHDKTWQLAANCGVWNLLRRFGDYWLPRNTRTGTDSIMGVCPHGSRRDSQEQTGLLKVINNYQRRGIHNPT